MQHERDHADPQLGRTDRRGQPVLGEHDALHDPRLPADLGEEPAGGVHQERQDDHPLRGPQEAPGGSQFVAAVQPQPPQADENHDDAEVGHHPHGPVLDEHVRYVVAGPELGDVLGLQRAEADDLAVPVVGGQQGQQVRDRQNLGRGVVVVAAPDLEQRERARLAGRPLRFSRRDLHGLVLGLDDAELVADQQRKQDRWH